MLDAFYRVRDLRGLQKKPSTSEVLDWIQALVIGGVPVEKLEKEIPFAGVLLKKTEDLKTGWRITDMFTDFLYLLRSYGMKTSLNEWNSLMDALEMNLNDASLTEFYYMARAVLVKKESEYDKFDQAFLAYFKNVQTFEDLPKEVLDWLAKAHAQTPYDKDEVDARFAGLDLDDIRKMMAERLKEQHEQHPRRQ